MMCWHRPGRTLASKTVVCRHCGVAIEYCPCVDDTYRKCNRNCSACGGSMWVAIVRGWRAAIATIISEVPSYGASPGMWILYK
jgi:hypothetical protein